MLKNGTLLKVNPDLIQALKNALDLRYLPLIQQANRRQRRTLPQEEVAEIDHPFKLTLMGERYKITGGYVFGYDTSTYLRDAEFDVANDGAIVNIAVEPDVINHDVRARFDFGRRSYYENSVYYYPLAEIKENGEVIQYQVGNLVTPFRRTYFPIIKGSLNSLIKVVEGEGDEVKFWLRKKDDSVEDEGTRWFGAAANQHLCTDDDEELCWKTTEAADVKVHESLANLIAVNDDGELALPLDNVKPGQVLTVSADGVAVEWSVSSGGGGSAALGVITVAGANDGYGAAKWKPVVLASDGTYTVDGSASEQTVIIPRA